MPRSTPTAATARTIVASLLFLLTLPTLAQTRPPGSDSVQSNLWVQNRLTVPRSTASCTDLRPPFVPGQVCYSTSTSSLLCHNGSSWQVCNIPGTVNLVTDGVDVDGDGTRELKYTYLGPSSQSLLLQAPTNPDAQTNNAPLILYAGSASDNTSAQFESALFTLYGFTGGQARTWISIDPATIAIGDSTAPAPVVVNGTSLTVNADLVVSPGKQINASNVTLVGPLNTTQRFTVSGGGIDITGDSTIIGTTTFGGGLVDISGGNRLTLTQASGQGPGISLRAYSGGQSYLGFDVLSWGGGATATPSYFSSTAAIIGKNGGMLKFYTDNTPASGTFTPTERMVISTGSVTMNLPLTLSGTSALTVGGTGSFSNDVTVTGDFNVRSGNGQGRIAFNGIWGSSDQVIPDSTTGSVITHSMGTLNFYNDGGLTIGTPYTPTRRFYIAGGSVRFENSTSVAIENSTSASLFEVVSTLAGGSAQIYLDRGAGTGAAAIRLYTAGVQNWAIGQTSGDANQVFRITYAPTGVTALLANGSTGAVTVFSGTFEIDGTASYPSSLLRIDRNTTADTATLLFSTNNAGTNGAYLQLTSSSTFGLTNNNGDIIWNADMTTATPAFFVRQAFRVVGGSFTSTFDGPVVASGNVTVGGTFRVNTGDTALGTTPATIGNVRSGGTAAQAGWLAVNVNGVTRYIPYWP